MSIGIIGAGAFGTALAMVLGRKTEVVLWGRDTAVMTEMARMRQSGPRLSGFALPEAVHPTSDLPRVAKAQTLLLCVPTQRMSSVLETLKQHVGQAALVACCKGIDVQTGLSPTGLIKAAVPECLPAVLTGPSFASDIAKGLPTALTLACSDPDRGDVLQTLLSTPTLRLYRTSDVIGAELGGALKNVIAIASGAALGAGLGRSAQAALMTRGFLELQRVALHFGAKPQTLMGLSGFGDLVLTCSSDQSRNFRYGFALGQGTPLAEDTTVEGRATVLSVTKLGLDLPICEAVAGLVQGEVNVQAAIQTLLARPLKEE